MTCIVPAISDCVVCIDSNCLNLSMLGCVTQPCKLHQRWMFPAAYVRRFQLLSSRVKQSRSYHRYEQGRLQASATFTKWEPPASAIEQDPLAAPLRPEQRDFKYVSSVPDLLAMLESLRDVGALAVDCEGVNLGRPGGKLTLLQLAARKSPRSNALHIFIVDVEKLGYKAFKYHTRSSNEEPLSLKKLLEAPDVTKHMFDVRNDCSALRKEHQISTQGAYDLQLAEVAVRQLKGILTKHVLPLDKVLCNYLPITAQMKEDVELGHYVSKHLHEGNRTDVWQERPLSEQLMNYAASDVRYLHQLANVLNKLLPAELIEKVRLETRRRIQVKEISSLQRSAAPDIVSLADIRQLTRAWGSAGSSSSSPVSTSSSAAAAAAPAAAAGGQAAANGTLHASPSAAAPQHGAHPTTAGSYSVTHLQSLAAPTHPDVASSSPTAQHPAPLPLAPQQQHGTSLDDQGGVQISQQPEDIAEGTCTSNVMALDTTAPVVTEGGSEAAATAAHVESTPAAPAPLDFSRSGSRRPPPPQLDCHASSSKPTSTPITLDQILAQPEFAARVEAAKAAAHAAAEQRRQQQDADHADDRNQLSLEHSLDANAADAYNTPSSHSSIQVDADAVPQAAPSVEVQPSHQHALGSPHNNGTGNASNNEHDDGGTALKATKSTAKEASKKLLPEDILRMGIPAQPTRDSKPALQLLRPQHRPKAT